MQVNGRTGKNCTTFCFKSGVTHHLRWLYDSGGGVSMSDGVDEVVKLAEKLQAPVCTTYLHNDSFPKSHKLWLGPLGYQVDTDHRRIGLTKHVDVGVCGDAKLFAQNLLSNLQAAGELACLQDASERVQKAQEIRDSWEKELDSLSRTSTQDEISPRHALRELENCLPANSMVSTDIGNICSVSNSYLRFDQPKSFFAAMSFGNCGYAFPAAMGAKVAAPDRPAVAYVGDGAWGMSLNEILTCVRENIPVIAVVFNNRQWGAEKKNQVDFYSNRFVGTNLVNPSFAEISRTMGGEGITVSNASDIKPSLEALLASNKPGVLEIKVSQELADPFRRDALKMPVRHLEKYKLFQ